MVQDKIIAFPQKRDAAERTSQYRLPLQLTPFIGREREVAAIRAMLRRPGVRLLTLTGTGGVGKTRLALEVACSMVDEFADGVCFVSLAPVNDPALVMPAIAQAFGLRETADHPLQEQLQAYLQQHEILLVLDNLEQIVAFAPRLAEFLAFCPDLHVLLTSRATLRIPGEYEFPVAPLSLPDLSRRPGHERIAQAAAVQLFIQRAQAVQPSFQLTPANAPIVANICARLDGLPLALELAAARIKLLPPQSLLKRLEHPLGILTRGASGSPSRQQTIRGTIQWSYDLLDDWEQRLFRLCSVFTGGFTLPAVEAIGSALYEGNSQATVPTGSIGSILDGVDSLVNKSLVLPPRQEDAEEEPRLGMLETIREYGRELLEQKGEMEDARRAHAAFYLQFVEETTRQTNWIKPLQRDYDNLRAAMSWMLETEGEKPGMQRIEMALRLASLLENFWRTQGYLSEGWSFIERALAKSEGASPGLLSQALVTASILLGNLGDRKRAQALLEQSLALSRELGDTNRIAYSLRNLGWLAYQDGNFPRSHALYEESLALFKDLNDRRGIALSLNNLAYLAQNQGDFEGAYRLFSESLAICRELGNTRLIISLLFQLAQLQYVSHENPPMNEIVRFLDECIALAQELSDKVNAAHARFLLGLLAFTQGDLVKARLLVEEHISFFTSIQDRRSQGVASAMLARIIAAQGDYATARALLEKSLAIADEVGDKTEITTLGLEGMALLAAASGQRVWAVRLWGAAEKLREDVAFPMIPVERGPYRRSVTELRAFFGEQIFAGLWAEGRAMSPEEALSANAALPPKQSSQPAQPVTVEKAPAFPAGLSAREVEVLRLLAQGLSDAEIADQLIISPRTVNTHLTSIYRKIQVTSRSAATRYASEHQLI